MIIQLIDNNQALVDEWDKLFKDCPDVKTYCDNFFDIPTNCFVSPANSYGFLDGGIDNHIRKYYEQKHNIDIEKTVQDFIIKHCNGELLVGQGVYLPLCSFEKPCPDIIISPTMRVPMKLPENSINVYLAMRAILLKLKSLEGNSRVKLVSISGLGTGIGKVPYDICAKQMKQAYDDVWLGKYKFPKTWKEAQDKHQLLYGDTVRDIQYEELDETTKKTYGLK